MLILQGVGEFVGEHWLLLVDGYPVEHVNGFGFGVVVSLDLLLEQREEEGLEVEVFVEEAEFFQDNLALLQALGALIVVEALLEVGFHGGAAGEAALDLGLDGQAGFLRGELHELVDEREELLGLLGSDVGFGPRLRGGVLVR